VRPSAGAMFITFDRIGASIIAIPGIFVNGRVSDQDRFRPIARTAAVQDNGNLIPTRNYLEY